MFGDVIADEVLSERERHLIGVVVAAYEGVCGLHGNVNEQSPGAAFLKMRWAVVNFAAAVNAGLVVTMEVTGHERHSSYDTHE